MEMNKVLLGVGDKVTIETCNMYHDLGYDCIWSDGKDLYLIGKDVKSSKENKFTNKSVAKNSSADKSNYSVICRRCGRKLTSEVSRNRGYGSYCYRKVASDLKRDDNKVEEINFIDEIKGVM